MLLNEHIIMKPEKAHIKLDKSSGVYKGLSTRKHGRSQCDLLSSSEFGQAQLSPLALLPPQASLVLSPTAPT